MKVERSALKCETLSVGKRRSADFSSGHSNPGLLPRVRRLSLATGYQSSPLVAPRELMEDVNVWRRWVAPNRPILSMRASSGSGGSIKTV
jgi:hypothetical protein